MKQKRVLNYYKTELTIWRQLSRGSINIQPRPARGCLIGGLAGPLKQRPQFITLGKSLNDSVADGSQTTIYTCFIPGDEVAWWLTSPCDGDIVAFEVLWRSLLGGTPATQEPAMGIHDAGNSFAPSAVYDQDGCQASLHDAKITPPGTRLDECTCASNRSRDPKVRATSRVAVTVGCTDEYASRGAGKGCGSGNRQICETQYWPGLFGMPQSGVG